MQKRSGGEDGREWMTYPPSDDTSDVHIFITQKDHTHTRNRRGRCEPQVVRLEQEVDIGTKIDSFAIGECKKVVIIKYRVERFDPLWINIIKEDTVQRPESCASEYGSGLHAIQRAPITARAPSMLKHKHFGIYIDVTK